MQMISSSRGTSERCQAGETGSSLITRKVRAVSDSSGRNGGRPVSSSYRIAPSEMQRARYRRQQLCGFARRRQLLFEILPEGAALDELHGKERRALDLAHLIDVDDVRVMQRSRSLGFGQKSVQLVLAEMAG